MFEICRGISVKVHYGFDRTRTIDVNHLSVSQMQKQLFKEVCCDKNVSADGSTVFAERKETGL
jgi:hypothetical protein